MDSAPVNVSILDIFRGSTTKPSTNSDKIHSKLPEDLSRELQRLVGLFSINTEQLTTIVSHFQRALETGLERDGTNIPMNVTWVTGLPDGSETGTILTLDLGGTNLRVCKVTLLEEKGAHELKQEQYEMSNDLKTGDAESLWEFCADSLEKFISNDEELKKHTPENPIPLGFTFSYPATQARLDHGILQRWTKGLEISGVEGQDAAGQLKEAIAAKNLPVNLVALINDTVGALIASLYTTPSTVIGAIFGTGCNAAYVESLAFIPKLQTADPDLPSSNHGLSPDTPMAINCEYGAFDPGPSILPRTPYDEQLDKTSPKPGEQTFEKLSAGKYLGEIFRLVLISLYKNNMLFSLSTSSSSSTLGNGSLEKEYVLDTGILSAIENDESRNLTATKGLFTEKFGLSILEEEAYFMQALARAIAIRGARLCACGVAAILRNKGLNKNLGSGGETLYVAADGSVALKHPHFRHRWNAALGEILGWEKGTREESAPVRIKAAEDGSGFGAGVIVAMAMRAK